MSSQAETGWQPASVFEQLVLQNYFIVAVTALFLYDYMLTLGQEVQVVWCRKFTGASLLYLFNRQLLFVYLCCWTVNAFVTIPCESGFILAQIANGSEVLFFVNAAAFSALRVYAIAHRNWQLSSIVFVLGFTSMAINIYLYSQQLSMTAPPPEYCVIIYGVAVKLYARLGIASIMANVAADTVVLSTTLYATYNIKQFANHATIKVSVTTLLLRDGTIYFSILLALNIANVIINLLNSVITISLFVSVFTSILISHLFLNLRQVHLAQGDTPSQPSQISDLQFASRIVGNIGAPLNHGLISDQIDEIIGSEDIEEIPQVVKEPLKDGLGLHDTNINLGLQESTV